MQRLMFHVVVMLLVSIEAFAVQREVSEVEAEPIMSGRYLFDAADREFVRVEKARADDAHSMHLKAPPQPDAVDLVRYLWDDKRPTEARYLWDDEKPTGARYLWDDEKPTEARYLWDDEKPTAARYLWETETGGPGRNLGEDTNKAQARYLWDSESAGTARYLWDDEMTTARYLWDGHSQGSQAVTVPTVQDRQHYVLMGRDLGSLKSHLRDLGAVVDDEIPAMNAVRVQLSAAQKSRISRKVVLALVPDGPIETANNMHGDQARLSHGDSKARERDSKQFNWHGRFRGDDSELSDGNDGIRRETFFPKLIDADLLHFDGVTGKGVGVAIIDTGAWETRSIRKNLDGRNRVVAYYDALQNLTPEEMSDESGHGSHIATIISSSRRSYDSEGPTGAYHGVAPDADLIIVKAFDAEGKGTYMDVIRAIAFVIAHKESHNIRVLNMSFSATPMSHYWQDPLNLAVMAAWRAGITVIASAGNSGPDPMTIGVPANVPYVVTVGAMTDSYTPDDTSDDRLASFSSSGPTLEGFVKPEVIAPGGHLLGEMSRDSRLAQEHPEFHDGFRYFLMSGTSQAAAVASGVAALILQQNPDLTPDDVKCRLMSSATVAEQADGSLAYSLFQQGTGLINAYAAVNGSTSGCANGGLDIAMDMSGEAHFGGPAGMLADGTYQISGVSNPWGTTENQSDSFIWNLSGLGSESFIWNLSFVWNLGFLEKNGGVWSQTDFEANGYYWNIAGLEEDGFVTNLSDPIGNSFLWNLNQPAQSVDQQSWVSATSSESTNSDVWNMGIPEDLVMVWQMSQTTTGSFIWNLSFLSNEVDSATTSFLWNLGGTENTSFIWNLNSVEGESFLWNLNGIENVSFLWNLNNVEGESFIWNLSELDGSSFLWNLNETENASFLWNLSAFDDSEQVSTASINHWVEQE
ncbi:MAG: S8 family peptidase [Proteobacteria bacterium]|nr:S8 family peptidase [Pseudomonadota bacterium]